MHNKGLAREEFPLLDEIGYQEFKEVIEKYKLEHELYSPQGDTLYLETIRKRNVWDNLNRISLDDVKNVVLYFLNKWRCRIPYECASELQKALQKTHTFFKSLSDKGLKLETVNFDEMVGTNGKSVKKIIKEIFDTISKVKAGRKTVGFTATTKIMHMVIPDLFVMCDGYIREAYGCAGNSEGYLNFLRRMQMASLKITKEKPKVEICKELYNGDRNLNKILDEYNHYTITVPIRKQKK